VRYPTWIATKVSCHLALGMFHSRVRRVRGFAAILAWSDLILDRSRKLDGLQSPAACATCSRIEDHGPIYAQSRTRPPDADARS